ncbi:DNA-binding transcriptional regulator, MarR family [Pedococcus dokdonensis]|uniref:DNA-binding transcriptional regulator, MarR family n=1 Tax=Pedococcus dokdonensis TaxID=443156 RepID=A0A1H0QKI3_9MICO|nr:MarR family transcriptional regulator [Pedococcus dokdonensis]SDP17817.1 DNA-binding transcriptional regulator, MarR family [Pedococcus dokdonensis]
MQPDRDVLALERIERELTLLVRRAQKVHLHTDVSTEPLERAAYAILGVVNDEGPLRAGTLAGRFRIDPSTVSRQAASLVAAGLMLREPDPDDGRACRFALTEHGRDALEATRAVRRRVMRQLLGAWPQEDRDAFASLLERFNAGLNSELASSGLVAAT